ncbi:MAG: hypothetical protein M3O46_13125, partial [Myxococcota bacterium]|nr:hypothetical protein [Myxococcota bacterium]
MQRALMTFGLMLMLSCGKDEPGGSTATTAPPPPPSPSAAAPPSTTNAPTAAPLVASAGPPPPTCPPGLVGNGFPAYCIKLPSTYAVKQARTAPKRGSIEYDTGTTTDNLMISYDESPISQVSKDVESEMKFGGDKLDKKGDLPGGNKWFQGTHAEYARIVTLFKGQGSLTLKCSFAYQAKKAPAKDAIDVCKS